MISRRYLIFAALLFTLSPLISNEYIKRQIIVLDIGKYHYNISNSSILHRSESVIADSLILINGLDYSMEYKTGVITFLKFPNVSYVQIEFLTIPNEYRSSYYSFIQTDSINLATEISKVSRQSLLYEKNTLKMKGNKTFSLSLTEKGETDVLQSLYIELAGELSRGVNISAQLSDSQSKLSPEGDSKELSNLDKVFLRIHSSKWEVGMGDLDVSFKGTKYINYYSKLEGLNAQYKDTNTFQAAYNAGGGKRANMQIQIIDGKQGPYYLLASNNQRSFQIIPGSEELYLNAEVQERGTDYFVDYDEGTIMFRKVVSSSDLVNAYFQYSDEYYRQSTILNSSEIHFGTAFALKHHFLLQTDAKNNPLLHSFNDADLDSLSNAGDSQTWSSGVSTVDVGTYRQRVSDTDELYYEYAPNDSLAIYNIVFSYVGTNLGDYIEFSKGRYRWVGERNGDWLPQKKLVSPTQKTNIDLSLKCDLGDVSLNVEGLYSNFDKNTLSELDDDDNHGGILYARLDRSTLHSRLLFLLEGEHRFANSYFFASQGTSEYEFASLPIADSLAQSTVNLSMQYQGIYWQPKLLLRWRSLQNQYTQEAFRISSTSIQHLMIPSMNLISTISRQDGILKSLIQYYNSDLSWKVMQYDIGVSGLWNYTTNEDPNIDNNSFLRLSPVFGLKNATQSTQLVHVYEETGKNMGKPQYYSNTYGLKHSSSLYKQSFNLDATHRVIRNTNSENPKSSYELVTLRSGNNLLNGFIQLFTNYSLNQTEFFPKIRELIYVGNSQGLYDSTGLEDRKSVV